MISKEKRKNFKKHKLMPSLVVLESVRIRPMRALKIPTILEHNLKITLLFAFTSGD